MRHPKAKYYDPVHVPLPNQTSCEEKESDRIVHGPSQLHQYVHA